MLTVLALEQDVVATLDTSDGAVPELDCVVHVHVELEEEILQSHNVVRFASVENPTLVIMLL